MTIAILILAAGAGSRYRSTQTDENGTPKQLANLAGKSLLVRVIALAESVAAGNIYVVLGYESQQILNHLTETKAIHSINYSVNQSWNTGIASSITLGVSQLPRSTEAVLILLADQVAIDKTDLQRLIEVYLRTNRVESRPLVCAEYGAFVQDDVIGVPAIFPRRYFDELQSLSGDQGAKSILLRHPHTSVPMPSAIIDIDTEQNLENYLETMSIPSRL